MAEIGRNRGTQNNYEVKKDNPQQIVCTSFARTATARHKQPQSAKLKDVPDAVREGVVCARQHSEAARNDSRGALVNSKLRPSSAKKS